MDKINQLKYWFLDHKTVMWSCIVFLFLLLTLPIGVYIVQQQTQPPPQAYSLECNNVQIYDQQWGLLNLDQIYIDDTVYITVSGGTTDSAGITKARFSFDNGATWQETTQKNIHDEFYIEYTVPDQNLVNVLAQVYNPNLGWK